MGFLYRLLKKKNPAEQTARQQPNGGNSQKPGRRLSGYSWLIIMLGIFLYASLWLFVWHQSNADYHRTIAETSQETGFILGAFMASLFILLFCGLLVNRHEEMQAQNRQLLMQKDEICAVNDKLVAANAAVQMEKDRLSALINSISDEVWFADTNKRITLANQASAQEFDLSSAETSIQDIASRLTVLRPDGSPRPVEESPTLRALQGEVVRNEQVIIQTPVSGHWRHREVSANPVRDADGNIIGAVRVVRDITERKAMEEELERHRDQLQTLVEEQVREIKEMNSEMTAIFESISDPFYVLDKQWRLTYINKAVEQAAGIRLIKTHIGQNIWELFPDLVGGELYQQFHEACAENQPIHSIFKSTVNETLFDVHLYPYDNGLFVYFRDVTEQKKYEAEIARLDRLNIIGEMAASIGHEVRNPMTTVRGYLQRFARKADLADREAFALMIEEIDRANAIITEFLGLAKNKTVTLILTDLNTVIRGLLPLLRADAFRRGNMIELELEDTPEVLADEKELRQCLLNLVGNGMDAMPEGGKVTIGTAVVGSQVVMTVRDHGPGIPPEIQAKLGTPFITTKETGTGLGVAVCYRIAQRHKATIEVETGPEGTAVHFIFSLKNKAG